MHFSQVRSSWLLAMHRACYWDVVQGVFLDNGTNESKIDAPSIRHTLFTVLLQSCYNCRLPFPQLLFLGLCHQSTRFIALSKIILPRHLLLAIILSISMLINSNREGRELTNVGEMVCLRIAKNERNRFRFSNRLGNTQGRVRPWRETAVIGNFESTNVR